jgi:hypothetical protein
MGGIAVNAGDDGENNCDFFVIRELAPDSANAIFDVAA